MAHGIICISLETRNIYHGNKLSLPTTHSRSSQGSLENQSFAVLIPISWCGNVHVPIYCLIHSLVLWQRDGKEKHRPSFSPI